jgi:hypothetical protein
MQMRCSIAVLLCLTGCSQSFYFARTTLPDDEGHEALAVWSVTERALWFDESSETVRVTVQCGKTVLFQEREGGVYMLYDPTSWEGPRRIATQDVCGEVVGVKKLDDIKVGETLTLSLWCAHKEDDEGFSIAAPILPTGTHALRNVQTSKSEPRVAPCPTPPQQ